jgi:type I restriction enzyme S subunit
MRKGWMYKTIGEVCDIANGGTPKTGVPEYWDGNNLWITPAEMGKRSSPYASDTERKITEMGLQNSSARILPPKSVILSSRAPIGHLVINTEPMAFNQGCKGLVPNADTYYKFLFYYLGSIVELLNTLGTGATFKELSGGKLKEVPIPVPPLAEQKRIVAVLDEAFAAIATAKAHAEKNLQNARALFDSHLNAVFSQRGDGWVETTLDQISTNLDFRRRPITKSERVAGHFPYYGASGVVDHVKEYIFDEDALLISEDGANLLARSTPIAFSVSGKYWVNNHAHIIRFERLDTQHFVEHYLESIRLDDYITGAAQPKLNQKSLNAIPIPIPSSVDAQAKIVAKINLLKSESKRLASIYQRKLAELEALKQSLLHQAFSGKL